MNTNEFLEAVPRPFKTAAWTISGCIVTGAIAIAWVNSARPIPSIVTLNIARGIGISLLAAAFVSAWVLSIGYVYADSRRRAMPPVLWTLVVAFVPNLLGFLLYFACRKPVALPCPHCGQDNMPGQRFCSWCGHVASGPLASEGKLA